jgi:hypothetical protein
MIEVGDKVKTLGIYGKNIPDNYTDLIFEITKKEYLERGLILFELIDENGNYYEVFGTKGLTKVKEEINGNNKRSIGSKRRTS